MVSGSRGSVRWRSSFLHSRVLKSTCARHQVVLQLKIASREGFECSHHKEIMKSVMTNVITLIILLYTNGNLTVCATNVYDCYVN